VTPVTAIAHDYMLLHKTRRSGNARNVLVAQICEIFKESRKPLDVLRFGLGNLVMAVPNDNIVGVK
jgi:hypothetical protein